MRTVLISLVLTVIAIVGAAASYRAGYNRGDRAGYEQGLDAAYADCQPGNPFNPLYRPAITDSDFEIGPLFVAKGGAD